MADVAQCRAPATGDMGARPIFGIFCHWCLSSITTCAEAVGGLSGDGVYGGRSEQACIKFQKEHDLKVDGEVGKITWDTTFAYQKDS